MPENKNQHYVSVFYLYNFTSESQKKLSTSKARETLIWHYDKKKKVIKKRPIKKIATEPYLFSYQIGHGDYDHSLDEQLKIVESQTAEALQKLNEIVTSFKKNSTKTINIDDKIIHSIIEFTTWQLKRHPDFVNETHQKCKEISEGKNWELPPKAMALDVLSGLGRDNYANFSDILRAKNKTILFTTNDRTSFITTDEPFVRFNKNQSDGISYDSTEIYFPLASNMLLYLHGSGNEVSNFRAENDRKFLREFNTYIANKAKNYIFASTKEHLESIVKRIQTP